MKPPKKIKHKNSATRQLEWDRIAEARLQQVLNGGDRNYLEIIRPWVIENIPEDIQESDHILDAGCGLADISQIVANKFSCRIDAVDFSLKHLKLADEYFFHPKVHLHHSDVMTFYDYGRYKCVIASMFLMDVPDADRHIKKMAKCLKQTGTIIVTMPHPAFWPLHRGYNRADWYNYSEEIPIEGPYSQTSKELANYYTTHYLRSLERYFNYFCAGGLSVRKFSEIDGLNGSKEFPKFLGLVLSK